MVDKIDMYR